MRLFQAIATVSAEVSTSSEGSTRARCAFKLTHGVTGRIQFSRVIRPGSGFSCLAVGPRPPSVPWVGGISNMAACLIKVWKLRRPERRQSKQEGSCRLPEPDLRSDTLTQAQYSLLEKGGSAHSLHSTGGYSRVQIPEGGDPWEPRQKLGASVPRREGFEPRIQTQAMQCFPVSGYLPEEGV